MTTECREIEQAKVNYEQSKRRKKLITAIAIVGANNATKSSLANVLSGHEKEGFFEVGEGPVTHAITSCEFEQRLYIDTPGTGFSSDDDVIAKGAYDQVDVFVMAHRIDSGELDAHEMKWLKNFLSIYKCELIIAVTASEMKDEQDQLKITAKIQEQLATLNMADTPIILVSCNRYNAGTEFSSADFIQLSGIEELQNEISHACEYVEQSRSRKLNKAKDHLLSAITDRIALFNQQKLSIVQEKERQSKDIKHAVDLIAETYS